MILRFLTRPWRCSDCILERPAAVASFLYCQKCPMHYLLLAQRERFAAAVRKAMVSG